MFMTVQLCDSACMCVHVNIPVCALAICLHSCVCVCACVRVRVFPCLLTSCQILLPTPTNPNTD